MKSKGLWNKAVGNKRSSVSVHCEFLTCANTGQDGIAAALRTYATWLVRAARREMAGFGPEKPPQNIPQNEVELT